MQRCSPSIAALVGALAKAQAQLVNPEKSLVGTIKAAGNGPADSGRREGEGTERIFRYASLADGLDIVRKTLGGHEIATVQQGRSARMRNEANLVRSREPFRWPEGQRHHAGRRGRGGQRERIL